MSDTPTFERDERGLVKGVTYHYTPAGKIDWRRMVDTKFLYVCDDFKDRACQEQGKTLTELDLTLVKDDWLRMRIGGINQIAHLRGVLSVDYPFIHITDSCVTMSCSITFIANFETQDAPLTFSSTASASMWNLDRKNTPYMATQAENRSYARTVKRALEINITGDFEIGGDGKGPPAPESVESATVKPAGFEARHLLEAKCIERKISFDTMKAAAALHINSWVKAPGEWKSFEDVQPTDAFFVLGKLGEAEEKRKAAKK